MPPKRVKATGNAVKSNVTTTAASAATSTTTTNKIITSSEGSSKSNHSVLVAENDPSLKHVDVQYNPDIVDNFLRELRKQTENKCSEIEAEADFLVTMLQQAFFVELMKFPKQIREMPLKKFKDEYNLTLDNLMTSQVNKPFTGPAPPNRAPISNNTSANNSHAFQTPSHKRAPATQLRNPKEGEVILSVNGSPLGEFRTVQKPINTNRSNILPPQTPGVYVPLQTGDVVDVTNIDVENLPPEMRSEALHKVQTMMENMRAIMEKLQTKADQEGIVLQPGYE